MSTLDFITVVEQESERFAQAVAPLTVRDRPVPACPDWAVRDLLVHLGEVQRFWAGAVLAGGDRPGAPDQADPGDGDPVEWYDQSRARLVDVLRAADPGAPCWAWWAPGQTVGDVARRQAHEAAVHRWDAESSAATPTPLEPALAADGVNEFFEWMLPACRPGWTGPAGTVRLAATDTDRVWSVRLGGPRPELLPGLAGEFDASVHASASDLDLLVWRRRGLDTPGVRVGGTGELVTTLLAWADLD